MAEASVLLLSRGENRAETLVLVRGYMHTNAPARTAAWVDAIRGGGFRGDVYQLCWDASHSRAALSNVFGFRDWKRMKRRARDTGRRYLGELLDEVPGESLTLVGVSAGARVLYHGLTAVEAETTTGTRVHDVVLLGGAIRSTGKKDWKRVACGIRGRLINVYSRRDVVLTTLYRATARGLPCGAAPLRLDHERICDLDATEVARGGLFHLEAHARFREALRVVVGPALWSDAEPTRALSLSA